MRQGLRSQAAQLRAVQLARRAQRRQAGQVVLEAREQVRHQPQAQQVLQREQVQRVRADQPASLEVRSALARLSAVREMFCFGNLGCSGAWARRCDLSAEQWKSTTATSNPNLGGRQVKQDAARVLGAVRQVGERDPGIPVLLLQLEVARRLTIRHLVKALAHPVAPQVHRVATRVLPLATLRQVGRMHQARHRARQVLEHQIL